MVPFPNMQFPQAAHVIKPVAPIVAPEPSLQSSPSREEGEVPESELDRSRLMAAEETVDAADIASWMKQANENEKVYNFRPTHGKINSLQ